MLIGLIIFLRRRRLLLVSLNVGKILFYHHWCDFNAILANSPPLDKSSSKALRYIIGLADVMSTIMFVLKYVITALKSRLKT